VARVVALGGAVVHAAEDTPYGRIAQVADPTGIEFRLVQPPA
jgi:predicted enzyme related to lactoylglutathione lyase